MRVLYCFVYVILLTSYITHIYIQMLHTALAEAVRTTSPSLSALLSTVTTALNPTRPASTSVHLAYTDLGCIQTPDINLIECLKPFFMSTYTANNNPWSVLPLAAALSVYSDKWDQAKYMSEYNTFRENEHCTVIALASLLPCLSHIPTILSDTILSLPPPPTTTTTHTPNTTYTIKSAILSIYYIQCLSKTILQLRQLENTSVHIHKSYRPITLLLPLFIQYSRGIIPYSILESNIPTILLHHTYMDISLGRQSQDQICNIKNITTTNSIYDNNSNIVSQLDLLGISDTSKKGENTGGSSAKSGRHSSRF